MENTLFSIFELVVLIFSVMIHEIAHGAVARVLGDSTAEDAGRLTLNPLKHIDPFGSIILPGLLLLIQSPILLGWAKPVPYNPNRLRDPKSGAAKIGAAGPLSNLLIALVFGIFLRIALPLGASETMLLLANAIVYINVLLAVFNLLPIPPLDGSQLLFALLPARYEELKNTLLRYGFFILILFIFFGGTILVPIVRAIYHLFAGPAALL